MKLVLPLHVFIILGIAAAQNSEDMTVLGRSFRSASTKMFLLLSVTACMVIESCVSTDVHGDFKESFILATETTKRQIHKLDLKSQSDVIVPISNDQFNPIAIDYDPYSGKIYWTDVASKQIRKANLDGSGERVLVQLGTTAVMDGLALDVPSQLIFYTDTGNDVIVVMTMGGLNRKNVIYEDLDQPRAIATDPSNGVIYWTDWGLNAKIEKASYDGSNRQVVVNTRLTWPNGLAIDVADDRMYWCDGKERRIESANLDGSDRKVLLDEANKPTVQYFGLALDLDTLYFTDWGRRSIMKLRTDGTGMQVFGQVDVGRFNDIYVHRYQGYKIKNGCSERSHGCSHLCLPRPYKTFICACPNGLTLQSNGVSCAEGSTKNNFLVFTDTNKKQIQLMNFDGQLYKTLRLPSQSMPIGIDYDPVSSDIYWTDNALKTIRSYSLSGNGKNINVQLVKTSVLSGLALDIPSQLIFYTDSGNKIIVLMTMKELDRKIIIHDNLERPTAIATDQVNGFIYWTDRGVNAKIEKANYDGSERQAIINTGLGWPTGLAVDSNGGVMYWCDALSLTVESSNLDGSERRVILNEKKALSTPIYFGLALDHDTLYVSDWTRRTVIKMGTDGRGLQNFGSDFSGFFNGIHVHRTNKKGQYVKNGCSEGKDRCSHLCLPRPSNKYICACPSGLVLHQDGVTCTRTFAPENFILVTDKYNEQMYIVDLDSESHGTIGLSLKIDPRNIIYNPKNKRVYWTDYQLNSILSTDLNGNVTRVHLSDAYSRITGLAIDVPSQLLFYSDPGRHIIAVIKLDGDVRKDIIYDNHMDPRAITTDPVNGVIYWSSVGTVAKIEKANYDGSGRQVIIETGLRLPNGLAVDISGGKIYWCDTETHLIESSNLDGSDRLILLDEADTPSPANYSGLAFDSDTLLFTALNRRSVMMLNIKENILQGYGPSAFGQIRGIHVHRSDNAKFNDKNGCSNGNGNCTHLCLPRPSNAHVCACPNGLALQRDGATCSQTISSKRFLFVASAYTKDLYAMDIDSQSYVPFTISKNTKPLNIEYNPHSNVIYWTNQTTQIMSTSLEGGGENITLDLPETSSIRDIAIDVHLQVIFYTDAGNDEIGAVAMNGSDVNEIINNGLDEPHAIVTDSVNRVIYWTDKGTNAKIEKANYDGTNRQVIVHSGLISPNGLALDISGNKMYWCDGRMVKIESADLDGSNRVVLLNEAEQLLVHYFALAVDGDDLYFTDFYRRSVMKLRTDGTGLQTFGPPRFERLIDIHVYRTGKERTNCKTTNQEADYCDAD